MKISMIGATAALAALALLGGCSSSVEHHSAEGASTSSSTSAQAAGSGETEVSSSEPEPAPQPTEAACSGLTGQQALDKWLGQVPPVERNTWDPAYADTAEYDPCLSLSFIVVPVKDSLASSPYQIMLFHNGNYLGTATASAYAYAPKVTRVSDSEIEVTYRTSASDRPTAGSPGTSTARFRWDAQANKVVMTGQVPNGVQGALPQSRQVDGSNSGSGDCGKSPEGFSVSAGASTSCAFALATVAAMMQAGLPAPGHYSSTFEVFSPVTGKTYLMVCSAGSDGEGTGHCRDLSGGTAEVNWQKRLSER